jgi:hypothetical protein
MLVLPVHAVVSSSNDPSPGETKGVLLVCLVPLQEFCRWAFKPVEVKEAALPISQQRLDRDGHSLPCCTGPLSAASLVARIHSPELCFVPLQFGIPLHITPTVITMDDSALRTQNCTLASPATAQLAVSPAQLGSWSRSKENPHGPCMYIHSLPEGWLVGRLKGVQQKQGLDPLPLQYSTQPLVIRERRHIMLKVRVTGHSSGPNQQLGFSDSVQAR